MKVAEELLLYSKAVTPTAYAHFREAMPSEAISFKAIRDTAALHGWTMPKPRGNELPAKRAFAKPSKPSTAALRAAQRSPLLPDPERGMRATPRIRRRRNNRRNKLSRSQSAAGMLPAANRPMPASPPPQARQESVEYQPSTPAFNLDVEPNALDGIANLKRKARSPLSCERPPARVRIAEAQPAVEVLQPPVAVENAQLGQATALPSASRKPCGDDGDGLMRQNPASSPVRSSTRVRISSLRRML